MSVAVAVVVLASPLALAMVPTRMLSMVGRAAACLGVCYAASLSTLTPLLSPRASAAATAHLPTAAVSVSTHPVAAVFAAATSVPGTVTATANTIAEIT